MHVRRLKEMSSFKHHSAFPKEKNIQSFLFPFACFNCNKSFKKPHSEEPRKCPKCHSEMTRLSRKFKPPKKDDLEAWRVVEYVVKAGFRYQSIHIGNGQQANYPITLREAESFVLAYQSHLKRPTF